MDKISTLLAIDLIHGLDSKIKKKIFESEAGFVDKTDTENTDLKHFNSRISDYLEQGFDQDNKIKKIMKELSDLNISIIPYFSDMFPDALKGVPSPKRDTLILYALGDLSLLKESGYAIVGRRDATHKSIKMARRISRSFAEKGKVVISGFARGIDKQALDSTMFRKGKAIMVLPNGIMDAYDKIEPYQSDIDAGRLLFISPWYPWASFNRFAALARNHMIYALSEKIYIPETRNSGGTWSGAIAGFKIGADIYVRLPDGNERNANDQLIFYGATPVDSYGEFVPDTITANFYEKVINLISQEPCTLTQIIEKLHINYKTSVVKNKLDSHSGISIKMQSGKKLYCAMKSLF